MSVEIQIHEAALQRVRDEALVKEEALNREISRLKEEQWPAPSSYPPDLKHLEKENSRLRVELQLQQGHVLSLSNQVLSLQQELKDLREFKSTREDIEATAHEMQLTLRGLTAAGSDLKATADRIRRDRSEGIYPSHPLLKGGPPSVDVRPDAYGRYITPPVGVSDVLYAGFAPRGGSTPLLPTDMVHVLSDENTQFRTLAVQLLGSEHHHASLKGEVLHHIMSHPSDFSKHASAPDTVESLATRCLRAGGNASRGNLLTLQGAADRFRARMVVHLLPHHAQLELRPLRSEPLMETEVALWLEEGREVYCPVRRAKG